MNSFRTARRRHSRIAQLEAMLANDGVTKETTIPQTEEEWLEQFRRWKQDGLYEQEPDFLWLFNRYEQALQQAQASSDPSFYPPVEFEPHCHEPLRISKWRSQWRFPEVHRTFSAMLNMSLRAMEGKPPITKAEWDQLKGWYLAQRDRLPCQAGAINLPNGKSLSRSAIDHELNVYDGIIMLGAESVLEDMRLLQQHFGK